MYVRMILEDQVSWSAYVRPYVRPKYTQDGEKYDAEDQHMDKTVRASPTIYVHPILEAQDNSKLGNKKKVLRVAQK